ncbi:MAG: hypothetical protein IJP92_00130 [Lachnospiraceae bacterium]|nr:hypothetical protein [Lachnospiraceae bacterium]
MNHNKRNRLILVILFLSLLFLLGGGFYYYRSTMPDIAFLNTLGMALQNAGEILLFNPVLTISEVVSDTAFWTNLQMPFNLLMWAFVLVSAVIPFIEVVFVFSVLDRFLGIFAGLTLQKKRILVIGYSESVQRMLAGKHQGKVYLCTDHMLPEDAERELHFHGVFVMNGVSLTEKDAEKRISSFVRKKKITHIVLSDESDSMNLQYYMLLSTLKTYEDKPVHFHVMMYDFELRCMLQDFFDERVVPPEQTATPESLDLRIFNLPQIQAEKLFREQPLYLGTGEDNSVHLLILGGGYYGEAVLLHAMNQAVLSSDNSIFIDVIDKDIQPLCDRLAHRFHSGYVRPGPDRSDGAEPAPHAPQVTFSIDGEDSDGEFRIRCYSADVYGDFFRDTLLKKLQEDNHPFTYVAVCISDPDTNLHCFNTLVHAGIYGIPFSLRMADVKTTHDYLAGFLPKGDETKAQTKAPVFLTGVRMESIGLDEIIDETQEQEIREYHLTYEKLNNGILSYGEVSSSMDDLWNKQKYYKRATNRALYHHKDVKQKMFDCQETWNNYLKEAKETGNPSDMAFSSLMLEKPDYAPLVAYAQTEHRRFNYFLASEGWGYDKEKKENQRLHDCLLDWDNLCKTKKNTLIYDLISVAVNPDAGA